MVFSPQFGVQPVYKGKTYLKCVDVLCCLYIIANKNLLLAPALTLQMAKSSTHFFWLFTHSVTTVALNCNNITSGTQVKKNNAGKKNVDPLKDLVGCSSAAVSLSVAQASIGCGAAEHCPSHPAHPDTPKNTI